MSNETSSLLLGFTLWAVTTHVAPLEEDRGVPNDPDKTMHNDMAMTAMDFCGSWISFSGPLNACGHCLTLGQGLIYVCFSVAVIVF